MKKSRLTLEQHQELGKELAEMRDRLTLIAVSIARIYATPRATPLLRAVERIDKFRSGMDDVIYHDFRDTESDATLSQIYYPPKKSDEPNQ